MSRSEYHATSGPRGEPPTNHAPQATVTGAATTGGDKVPGAAVRPRDQGGAEPPVTITLCDGSQFTFSRFVDDRVPAEA